MVEKDSGLEAVLASFIRYTELSAVKYDAKQDIIKLEIALNRCISDQNRCRFMDRYRQSMELFYKINKIEPSFVDLEFIEKSGITIIRLYREMVYLQEEEIELFVWLLRQEFASLLVKDENDIFAATELSGDFKDTLLKKIRETGQPYQNIFAFRDEGRVFVFNK